MMLALASPQAFMNTSAGKKFFSAESILNFQELGDLSKQQMQDTLKSCAAKKSAPR